MSSAPFRPTAREVLEAFGGESHSLHTASSKLETAHGIELACTCGETFLLTKQLVRSKPWKWCRPEELQSVRRWRWEDVTAGLNEVGAPRS